MPIRFDIHIRSTTSCRALTQSRILLGTNCCNYDIGERVLLSFISTLVELLVELGVELSLFIGLAGRVALVGEIALDLFVVRPLLS